VAFNTCVLLIGFSLDGQRLTGKLYARTASRYRSVVKGIAAIVPWWTPSLNPSGQSGYGSATKTPNTTQRMQYSIISIGFIIQEGDICRRVENAPWPSNGRQTKWVERPKRKLEKTNMSNIDGWRL
jgi:pimeloyl-ACP methyl ester carboxylesterase